jgi:hypothetical protein
MVMVCGKVEMRMIEVEVLGIRHPCLPNKKYLEKYLNNI